MSTIKSITVHGKMTRLWYLFTAGSGDEQLANGYRKVKPVKTKLN